MDLNQCDLFKFAPTGNDGAELRIQVLVELFGIHEVLFLSWVVVYVNFV